MRLPRGLLLELAAQGLLLALALGLVLGFGLPDHAPRAFALVILAVTMAVPAAYGAVVIVRAMRRRRWPARSGRA